MTERTTRRRGDGPAATERGFDRLVAFTDAVVAIALTLIVLPLVDLAADPKLASAAEFFAEGSGRLAAAALSFVLIGLFWREHHAELERADRYTRTLVNLNLLWLAPIVFLPVPTALLFSTRSSDLLGADLYIGTMLASMIVMRLIQIEIARHATAEGGEPLPRWRLAVEWLPVGLMAVAMLVSSLGAGTRALLLLILAFPAQALIDRLHARWTRRAAAS